MAAVFLGEASLDIIQSVACVILWSITDKRALWLRPWLVDSASKQAWCKFPFEVSPLFGNKLDSSMAQAVNRGRVQIVQERHALTGPGKSLVRAGREASRPRE